jgi:hypothetical protein
MAAMTVLLPCRARAYASIGAGDQWFIIIDAEVITLVEYFRQYLD